MGEMLAERLRELVLESVLSPALGGLVIGHSVAAALGVPVTAIFGPTDERVTPPVGSHEVLTQPVWCRPCLFRDCPIDHRCMTRTSDDSVFRAVAGQLATLRLTPPG